MGNITGIIYFSFSTYLEEHELESESEINLFGNDFATLSGQFFCNVDQFLFNHFYRSIP